MLTNQLVILRVINEESFIQSFHTNQIVDKRKVFFIGELQLTNAESMVELENHLVAILNEKMDLGNNHQWKLKPLEKGRGGTFIMDLQTDASG